MGRDEITEFFAALNQDEPQASPLTPAVQQDVLSSRRLPPTTLPSLEQECLATFPPTVLLTLGLPKHRAQIAIPI